MASLRLSLAELRRHPGRIVAILIAVAISVAFMVASFSVVRTEFNHVGRQVSARLADSDLAVQTLGTDVDRTLTALRGVDGVAAAEPLWMTYGTYTIGDRSAAGSTSAVATDPRLQSGTLAEGRWASTDREITLDGTTAESLGAKLGDTLKPSWQSASGSVQGEPLEVVGITRKARGLLFGTDISGWTVASHFTAMPAEDRTNAVSEFLVLADPGVQPDSLVAPIRKALEPLAEAPAKEQGYSTAELLEQSVHTTAQARQDAIEQMTNDANPFSLLLLAFASIAMLVGALIIANTFAILIAQRRRQIGLLRAVGASRGQVYRGIVIEALIIGIVGALLGVALAIGLTAAVGAYTGSVDSGLVLPIGPILGSVAAGIVVTVLASLGSAGAAGATSPMEALNPVGTVRSRRRAAVARLVICGVLGLAGIAVIIWSRTITGENVLLVAILGSALLAVALLGGAPGYVPFLLKLLAAPLRALGPVGRVAGQNLVRNPQRAAATCVALMLAVGLTVTLQVGAASSQSTLLRDIDERYPVDISLATYDGTALPSGLAADLGQVAGVEKVTTMPTLNGNWEQGGGTIWGVDPTAVDPLLPGPLPAMSDDTVVLPPTEGLKEGDTVTVATYSPDGGDERTAQLQVRFHQAAQVGALVTPTTLTKLAGGKAPAISGAWLATDPTAAANTVSADVQTVVQKALPDRVQIDGGVAEAGLYITVLNTLVAITTGLLGAAVLIALVGVGNTLALSVIERTRESALLRALGLRRGQLRLMLLLEAVLLAVGGALIGVVVGMFFGWLGASSLMKVLEQGEAQFAISVPQTLAVLGVALVAAALASVLPGRRAALAAPTAALAET